MMCFFRFHTRPSHEFSGSISMKEIDVLLGLLSIDYPIIQAPMAGVSTPQMAAAVSNAGGLGSIGVGASTVEKAREMIVATKALTKKPFNVNVFCHRAARVDAGVEGAWLHFLQPYFAQFGASAPAALTEIYKSFLADRALLEVMLEEKPAVVSFHFGVPPAEWVAELRSAGIKTLASATSPAEARLAEAAGVDAIVAQGAEAGGHRGIFDDEETDLQRGTFALIPLVVQAVNIPVIAAGGIMTGAGIAAAFSLGASAVQMGTAFILCPESAANQAYRAMLKSERAHDTRITAAISGRPARGMANRIHLELLAHPERPDIPDYPVTYDAMKALHAAASAAGDHEFAAYWAGQGAPLARELPAAELVGVLVREWQEARKGDAAADR
jgi:nitronate monooxygenase